MNISRRELLVRTAQTSVAVTSSSVFASPTEFNTSTKPAQIVCYINGKSVGRAEALAWEARRMIHVWRKLRGHAVVPVRSQLDSLLFTSEASLAGIEQWRQDLLGLKLQLGSQRLAKILSTELALSRRVEDLLLKTSSGRYALSVIDVQCDKGTAAGFVQWFNERVNGNDSSAMLIANPDHYVIETLDTGQQYVLETTGGSPLATEFNIDYGDAQGNPTPLIYSLPYRVGGVALRGTTPIGYAYHQFGEARGGGFRGRLTVAFPKTTPWFMISGHQWHLAVEFSNWIEGYLRSP